MTSIFIRLISNMLFTNYIVLISTNVCRDWAKEFWPVASRAQNQEFYEPCSKCRSPTVI